MMRRLVVLGTGTGVGKTHVTRSLAQALATADPQAAVAALKPIETGLAGAATTDAAELAAVCRGVQLPCPHPLFGFAEPVTPLLAARWQGRPIQLSEIRPWLETATYHTTSRVWQLVESAGGALSPISEDACNFDLAQLLTPASWVLVGPDNLGALHEVRATWEALSARGRAPDHLVLSAARAPDASTGTNAGVLREFGIHASAVLAHGSSDLDEWARRLVAEAGS